MKTNINLDLFIFFFIRMERSALPKLKIGESAKTSSLNFDSVCPVIWKNSAKNTNQNKRFHHLFRRKTTPKIAFKNGKPLEINIPTYNDCFEVD